MKTRKTTPKPPPRVITPPQTAHDTIDGIYIGCGRGLTTYHQREAERMRLIREQVERKTHRK